MQIEPNVTISSINKAAVLHLANVAAILNGGAYFWNDIEIKETSQLHKKGIGSALI